MIGMIGKKIGMTRIFDKNGISIPVTVIRLHDNQIIYIKNISDKNCKVIQVSVEEKKTKYIKKSEIGYFSKFGLKVGKIVREFKTKENKVYSIGEKIRISNLKNVKVVDITGISKGKGFSGTIKRWNFRSQDSSHGNSLSHRAPGSIGQNQTPGKVFKGKKMAGRMGNNRVTIQNLKIIHIDSEKNILLVKGSVPGRKNSVVLINRSIKKGS
ncbi:50S ribosomal protein L3 [Candidatus Riesia sp. GBBU]|nr:50S ribosomal protein L3 [Candidatus Riesia sp. GBBU]